jgi:hypothetical protein
VERTPEPSRMMGLINIGWVRWFHGSLLARVDVQMVWWWNGDPRCRTTTVSFFSTRFCVAWSTSTLHRCWKFRSSPAGNGKQD